MAATIWKFELPVADVAMVVMPADARVLTVAAVGTRAYVWALVDPDASMESREFAVRGTGHPVGDVGDYVGTFLVDGGQFVFHVFEAGARL
jgi:hypothetical protein